MKKLTLSSTISLLAVVATGCIDNNYDLSDIDTTVKVEVNHLIVPINIDEITMESILDLKDDAIKVIDGAYTYVVEGDVSSSTITVNPVVVNIDPISQVGYSCDLPSFPGTLDAIDFPVSFDPGNEALTQYDFTAASISDNIYELSYITGDFNANVKFRFEGVSSALSSIDLNNFKIQLPKHLDIDLAEGQSYDPATGVMMLTYARSPLTFTVPINATGLHVEADAFDAYSHSLVVAGETGIIGGSLVLHTVAGGTLPKSMRLTADIIFPNQVNISSIDGKIGYDIEDADIPDVSLDNLPEVLTQPGTNIILAEPRLYVNLTNPMASANMYAISGLAITAYHGEDGTTYEIDDKTFRIDANPVNNFCFSPTAPTVANADYPNAKYVPFSQLGRVLSGDGTPERLHVDLANPYLPVQPVTGFKLGHDYGDVCGHYSFIAPLQFCEGSRISYETTVDGWSDDLKDLVVTALEVNLVVSTDIPVMATCEAYPLDANGNRKPGVTIEGASIDANANNQHVTIRLTGEVRELDGLQIQVAAFAKDGNALSPSMHVTLTDIRPCVSGYYTTEL